MKMQPTLEADIDILRKYINEIEIDALGYGRSEWSRLTSALDRIETFINKTTEGSCSVEVTVNGTAYQIGSGPLAIVRLSGARKR
jgi:hypothetical protein